LECSFAFNNKFRELFSKYTNQNKFKFNADMAAVWKKVKENNDANFTIKDMIDVYYKKIIMQNMIILHVNGINS
ncbi:hypothetical protein R4K48_13945, partial [Brachyspira pulli]